MLPSRQPHEHLELEGPPRLTAADLLAAKPEAWVSTRRHMAVHKLAEPTGPRGGVTVSRWGHTGKTATLKPGLKGFTSTSGGPTTIAGVAQRVGARPRVFGRVPLDRNSSVVHQEAALRSAKPPSREELRRVFPGRKDLYSDAGNRLRGLYGQR